MFSRVLLIFPKAFLTPLIDKSFTLEAYITLFLSIFHPTSPILSLDLSHLSTSLYQPHETLNLWQDFQFILFFIVKKSNQS